MLGYALTRAVFCYIILACIDETCILPCLGFAFIEFEDPRDAEDAVRDMDGRYICGVRIRCELAKANSRSGVLFMFMNNMGDYIFNHTAFLQASALCMFLNVLLLYNICSK